MSLLGFICGVPNEHCCGGFLNCDPDLQHKKFHTSRKQAFNCYVKYMIKEKGYKKFGAHDLFKEGEPILMLGKVGNFGGELRRGKNEQGHKRLMPKYRTSGMIH